MTTWTLSGFGDEIDSDPNIQASVLAGLGARHIEVRSAWNKNIVELDDADLDLLAAVLTKRGLSVSAIGSPIGKIQIRDSAACATEIDRLDRVITAAKRLNARYIRIFSFFLDGVDSASSVRDDVLTQLRSFAELAERRDVVLVHENEKDIYGDVPARVLDIIEAVGSEHLRVAWDSANFVQVGVRPFTDAYGLLREHIEYLQVKDAVMATGTVVPAGEGDGELRETIAALRRDGFSGFASLEPHLAEQHELGGFSGPASFGRAARAFRGLTDDAGVTLV
jgi:sugar phosphate isomerase/epimerase